MKHCFLIIAHDNLKVTIKLIDLMNRKDSYFFVHIDKKTKNCSEIINRFKYCENIFFIKRKRVYWGDYSLIKITLSMFELSAKFNFDFYHLISGTTLPIKNIDKIYSFYNKHKNTEFVSMFPDGYRILHRYTHWYIIPRSLEKYKILKFIQKIFYLFPRTIKFNKQYFKASEWCSLTNDFVHYVLNNKKWIRNTFKFTHCCDEMFIPTLLMNSSFKERNYGSNMLFVDWNDIFNQKTHLPILLDSKYINVLKKTDCMFARKFSESTMDLVDEFLK